MNFKVVPFSASTTRHGSSSDIASQLQNTIDSESSEGWEYYRMESVETYILPSGGCFGFGGKPGFNSSFHVLVFKKAS